ncbi:MULTISPECIES: HigA family addiction module antitoxin [unclassified Moorena]|uniref:HigA family addiction module antitoxin n=1 Tax=unclassified Moorena TaxID=2683338 RepID=UPI0013BBFCAD|nr:MULTISPECIES: HigA family addiction module antitoxin [unclassified Moorena]NEO68876.1 HigA family addiction module antidote protein [Moorena sp. SIO3H5]NEO77160.1 HigA family addiction module antidote protein [Moorena sp. SIO4G3]
MTTKLTPITPGEILLEEFIKPLGISENQLAQDIHVPVTRINGIVNGKKTITTDTALRLARYFGTTAQFWLNLQQHYELELAEATLADQILNTIKPLASIASNEYET